MTTVILVRHGQSEANLKRVFAGHFDVDLTENGYSQAKKAGEYIKENYKVDKVYASDLKRAFETGRCIAEINNVEIVKNENLREIRAGEWEGKSFDCLSTDYVESYGVWLNDIGNSRCLNGESTRELGERVYNELTKIAEENDGKTIVIATHATPIRAMRCLITKSSLDEMKDVPWVTNASSTELSYKNGKWSTVKIGIDSYLSDMKTGFPANV